MAKILTGSTISYGSTLPASASIPDGTLFFLTTAYTDPANSPTNPTASSISRVPGLLLFNFQQDSNPLIAGDQVGQIWKQLSTLQVFVDKTGDTMTGPLSIDLGNTNPQLRLISTTPGIRFTETDQAVNTREWLVAVDGGSLQIQTRSDAFAAQNTVFSINRSGGATINGGTVWHSNNDGVDSGLDSDLLDGQQGTFYLSSANHTGTVPLNRGGTNSTSTISGGVVYGSATQLLTSIAGATGQVLVSGGAGAPSWVNSSALGTGSSATAAALSPGATIALSGGATGTATLFTGESAITIPVTALNAGNISDGTVPVDRLGSSGTRNSTTFLSGDNTWQPITVNNGTLTLSVTGPGLSGSATFTANQSGASTFTVASNATSNNNPSTLVFRNGAGDFSAGTITASLVGAVTLPAGPAYPSLNLHAVPKQYVDSIAQGLITRPAARAATTGNLTATYNNGASGVGATLTGTGALPTIDGVTLAVGNGVLVRAQTTAAHNGRYVVTTLSPNWVLTRCGLCDEASEIPSSYVFINEGTLYAGTGWVQTVVNAGTFVVGTGAITVTQFSSAGSFSAGTGIDITSGIISLANNYGDTKNPYAAKTANRILAGPASGIAAAPEFRALVPADIPSTTVGANLLALANPGQVSFLRINNNNSVAARTAAEFRTDIGTTVGANLLGLTNPGQVSFLRINDNNSVSALDATNFRTAIGTTVGANLLALATPAQVSFLRVNNIGTVAARTAAEFRTDIGTTVGANLLGLTNPGAITFLRVNADNTVTARSAADFRTDIGAGTGTVTAVTGTSPVDSSGGATPAISLSSGYGDTQNPYAAKAANRILAGPASGGDAVPGFRALVLADMNATPTGVNTGTVVSRGTSGAVEVGPLTATTGTFSNAITTTGNSIEIRGANPRINFVETDNSNKTWIAIVDGGAWSLRENTTSTTRLSVAPGGGTAISSTLSVLSDVNLGTNGASVISASNNRIRNVAAPVVDSDAVNLGTLIGGANSVIASGTWTPTLAFRTFSGPGDSITTYTPFDGTYTQRAGTWTRIGNLIYILAFIQIGSIGNAQLGQAVLIDLPNTPQGVHPLIVSYNSSLSPLASDHLQGLVNVNVNTNGGIIEIRRWSANGDTQFINKEDFFAAGTILQTTGWFTADLGAVIIPPQATNGNSYSETGTGEFSALAGISVNTNGTITCGGTFAGANGWYNPTTVDIGNSHWVRATLTSGSGAGSIGGTLPLDTWTQINTSRSVTLFSEIGVPETSSANISFSISTSPSGTPVVGTFTAALTVVTTGDDNPLP